MLLAVLLPDLPFVALRFPFSIRLCVYMRIYNSVVMFVPYWCRSRCEPSSSQNLLKWGWINVERDRNKHGQMMTNVNM